MERFLWRCPNCGAALVPQPQPHPTVLQCENRHSFDIAKQGYVNLLLPQKRGGTPPGDSADMVRARTAFLEAGYYKAFSDGVNRLCLDTLQSSGIRAPVIADAGCGEGYYTHRLCAYLREHRLDAACVGFDLSKDAVSHASRCAKADGMQHCLSFAVASLFEMPLADGVCDGVMNLFAPVADAEFARILKPNGFLLMAVPAENHLFGLKCAVYDTPYKNEVRRDVLSHFRLMDVTRITDTVTLNDNAHIRALFQMTPYYWKTSQKDQQKLFALSSLTTEIAFDLLLYQKVDARGSTPNPAKGTF